MFVITGVTGQVGGIVAARLLKAGVPIRAVARNAEKAAEWKDKGAELALAEMTDADALTRAFAGADGVFLLIPPTKTALLSSRPAKVVCLSTIGAQAREPNLLSQLGLVEQTLSALPMPIAFLRAGWFMENTAWDIAPARETCVLSSFLQPLDQPLQGRNDSAHFHKAGGRIEGPYPMVSVFDVGAKAAELLRHEWVGKQVVELTGPEGVTPNDIASVLSSILGKPVRAEPVARDTWEQIFTDQGMQNPLPRMRMIDGFNEGWIRFEGEPVKGTTTLDTAMSRLICPGR
ncbi:NAD-dependent epimerase/dehydratase family protein [Rhizobium ruizarguesonis]|uniref:NAD-dependent epimerase/dehydratase family protein n=1 Tax=Rhizobium ruizarguesonis TaxID=2081791 RepID=A0ABY1WX94_9HYPH|nr:NmrA family NAD(P)-binding protein [Rhizobium ruizarguesonis]TAU28287.1 NAD-dependent epimerase/dehydratase family protein [Rhizobium ruizarguesonis]TAU57178.1 NAD-dependent epimerase/dehydratase family protein [Rhizobium ruizarguesonis]TAU60667.1 NAD-dependent epimerase/dehydratase family protein [Rhizobium ruizarguesonis]TAV01899.1 NAD-dependent epimerase/dehydratase family protein [Rhizobium ruizarguesonis]TAV19989.1 NAD-dependent epimerase/dehydratase family protein [Rhizobium ruizargue